VALSFKSPEPRHRFHLAKEKAALSRHFTKRKVPTSRPGTLLLASWNVANLGVQGRTPNARKLIAHVLQRFDLIAIQEVKDDFRDFTDVLSHMGGSFDYVMTDTAGNTERLAFIYRKNKVSPANLFGEVALRDREYPKRTVKVKWTDRQKRERIDTFLKLRFRPFDRNPFIGSFVSGAVRFTLVNVHLYFGGFRDSRKKEERKKYARRVLEIYAMSRWADRRFDKDSTYDKDIILLGDMNVPAMNQRDSTYKALVRFGWKPLEYVSKTGGSNLGNDKSYDQMVFAPGTIGGRVLNFGIFDFDNAVFRPLWNLISSDLPHTRAVSLFNRHVRHHLSDHRPLWIELNIS